MTIFGTSGNDTLTGTSGDDTFDLRQGGDDTASGLAGHDLFLLGATFTAADRIDGGADRDTLRLVGDYSAGVTFGAATLVNVENIQLGAGFSYSLTTNDATVAAGAILTVDGSGLGAGDVLTFDGANESDGRFRILAGAGDDDITGGLGGDVFDLSAGGIDTVAGRGGNDTFLLGGTLTAADHIDGGSGSDTVLLDGSYGGANALILAPATLSSVETIALAAGHNYNLITDDATVVANGTLIVDAHSLGSGDMLVFDGSAESNGRFHIFGGAGNDRITGGNYGGPGAGDTIDISQGGRDLVTGGIGNDTILVGAALTPADAIDGGAGVNTLDLNGDYSGGRALVLGGTTFNNISELVLEGGHDYAITENNANVAAGAGLDVICASDSGNTTVFDGSAETDGSFAFTIGAGDATLTGGAGKDSFTGTGALDILSGGGGDDHFTMTAQFNAADRIDGGAGNDTLTFMGGFDITFAAGTIASVETIDFAQFNNTTFNIVENDGNVAAGETLTVDARNPRTNSRVNFDGSAETDGHFHFINGFSQDSFIGGALSDSFDFTRREQTVGQGGGGADTFTVGALLNGHTYTFVYAAASDSTSVNYDTISGSLNFSGHAVFEVSGAGGAVTGVDAGAAGTLSTASFDSDLASAVGAGQMAAHHAMLFTANAGTLSGHTFLVIDENGTAGYQAGADLVIDVTGATGTLTAGDFA
ncbi:MAG TPA: bluetail domain-containing putative surface protein [Rhizomicrobium sp.]|nr:bluetail domain-containing putative surface protein [Rhizomicrobium sp.]